MGKEKTRISVLDGFRAIAIVSVMLYHYFSRWTPPNNETSLYPYDDLYNYFTWGDHGVKFFFIISGFVIYFTLEKTENLILFWKKRIIRLLPSIIIASFLTFFFFTFFDSGRVFPESHSVKNFIPSISFINPALINTVFDIDVSYLNGSYWSLWPEIQFYFLVSCIYYLNRNRFIANFIIVSITLILLNYLVQNIQGSNKLNIEISDSLLNWYTIWITKGFDLITYLPFFSMGTLAYLLYKNNNEKNKTSLFLKLCATFIIIFILYTGANMPVRFVYFLMVVLFATFIYLPSKLSVLENPLITEIGESSYFLYLIHENIGVFIIYALGQFIFPDSFFTPLLLMIGLAYLSFLFTAKIDKPISRLLKKIVLKK